MKIICIGRNYASHAKEMNAERPTEPIFFLKPDTALNRESVLYYPDFTADLHYEIELVVKICKVGKHIDPAYAADYYQEIGLGIDFTARDVQLICKEKGLPWEKAKGFDCSAVLGQEFISKEDLPTSICFQLTKNGEIVQNGRSEDMLFSINELISYISKYITLKTGDLIYTGTPEGVGAVEIGDELCGTLEGKELFRLVVK